MRWLSTSEAADRLGLHRVSVLRHVRSGHIPALVLGNTVRIAEDVVDEMVAKARGETEPEADRARA